MKLFFVSSIIGVFMRKMLILFFCVLSLGAMDTKRVPPEVESLHFYGWVLAKENFERGKREAFFCLRSFLPFLPTGGFSVSQLYSFRLAEFAVVHDRCRDATDHLYDLVKSGLPENVALIIELEYIKACRRVYYGMDFNTRLRQIYSELKNADLSEEGPSSWPIFMEGFSQLKKDGSFLRLRVEDFYDQLKKAEA